jgi:putative oxidoreductase
MNLVERVEHWGDAHHPKWMDIVRIALGVFLCYKGAEFLTNTSIITGYLSPRVSYGAFSVIMLTHYIVFAHILGGILLVLGVLTRFACLIQIPILVGALVFMGRAGGMFRPFGEIVLTLVVLLLLIYFLVIGNGPLSFKLADVERKKRSDVI